MLYNRCESENPCETGNFLLKGFYVNLASIIWLGLGSDDVDVYAKARKSEVAEHPGY